MKPARNTLWRGWDGEVRIGWRLAPILTFCVVGLLALAEINELNVEQRLREDQEKAELREMVRRIDERTERLERSCMEVCGD